MGLRHDTQSGWGTKTDTLFTSLYFGFFIYTMRGLVPGMPRDLFYHCKRSL